MVCTRVFARVLQAVVRRAEKFSQILVWKVAQDHGYIVVEVVSNGNAAVVQTTFTQVCKPFQSLDCTQYTTVVVVESCIAYTQEPVDVIQTFSSAFSIHSYKGFFFRQALLPFYSPSCTTFGVFCTPVVPVVLVVCSGSCISFQPSLPAFKISDCRQTCNVVCIHVQPFLE